MESPEYNSLPIILVSAKDQDSARTVISQIIDNEPEMCNNDNSDNNPKYAWRILNKYYTTDVRFHPLSDGEELIKQLEGQIEGHIVYLTETELIDKIKAIELMENRMRAGKTADVRVVVADCKLEENVLVSSCVERHYEMIPLRAPADPETNEAAGLDRVRAAFHAHVWTGIQIQNYPLHVLENDSDSDSWSSWQGVDKPRDDEDEELSVQRAEAFAAALRSLPEAVADVRRSNGNRIARAEMVISAFCEALGEPLYMPEEPYDREL